MTKEKKKEYNKKYYQKNREKILKQKQEYHQANKEQAKEYKSKYYQANREEINRKRREYYWANKEQIKEYKSKYYRANKEEIAEYNRRRYQANRKEKIEYAKYWRKNNPQKTREISARQDNKRKRNLGFIPINKPFEGCEFHHLDKDSGIYIPKWLHKACYPHNVWTGKGMDKANETAIRWWMINQCKDIGEVK